MFSRRSLLLAAGCAGAAALGSCTARGQMALVAEPGRGTTVYPVFVGTNRPLDEGNYPMLGRSQTLRFARFDVSIPATRQPGRIQWPGSPPDPDTEFVTRDAVRYATEDDLLRDIRRNLALYPPGSREIVLFVHGYNTNLAEGVYRLAQMDHDLDLRATSVYFGWPSSERALGYVEDRDSALFSRPDLERWLHILRRANADRIILLGHSMGCLLALEMMVKLDLESPGSVPSLIDSVVLISPDVDVDVAQRQLQSISVLPDPFIIFTSDEDKALRLSERIGGRRPRLGKNPDVSRFSDVDVTFLDVTAFNDPDAGDFGHLTVGSSPALIDLIPQLRDVADSIDGDFASNPGLFPGSILSVRRATEIVLSPGP